jgi:hypothetical protein
VIVSFVSTYTSCNRTSLVGRLFGSGSSSFLMNSLASGDTSFQYRSWKMTRPFLHSSIRSARFSDRNGEYPQRSVYVMTPMDHMSTGFPCPFLSITSGAAYPNEPAMVVKTSLLESSILAIPKSASTRDEFASRVRYRRFSGLRSTQVSAAEIVGKMLYVPRWTTLFPWR